jgi:tetratricopeptide (TPR) repeat protein
VSAIAAGVAPARRPKPIFVSFAAEDERFTGNLIDVLRSLGQHVHAVPWPAAAERRERDDDLVATDSANVEPEALIDACDAFVLIVSPTGIQSDAWRRRLAYVMADRSKSRRLIPVLRAGAGPEILRSLPELTLTRATAAVATVPNVVKPIVFPDSGDFAAPFRLLAQALGLDTRVHVFISYSRRDRPFADALDQGLRSSGKRTWIDRSDLLPTDDWMRAIKLGIAAADNFLFVITPDSVDSRYCKVEVEHAVGLRKRIVPVLRSATDDDRIPMELRARQRIEFRDADGLGGVLEQVLGALDRDADYAADHTRFLLRALDWQAKGKDRHLLLRGGEVQEAGAWLAKCEAGRQPEGTALQKEFIRASQRRDVRFRRLRIGIGIVLFAIMTAVGVREYVVRTDNYQSRTIRADAPNWIDSANPESVEGWIIALALSNDTSEAIATATRVKDYSKRGIAFRRLVRVLMHKSRLEDARLAARAAASAALIGADGSVRDITISGAAEDLAAVKLKDEAITAAKRITSPSDRAHALTMIGNALRVADLVDDAKQAAHAALAEAKHLVDVLDRHLAFRGVISLFLALGSIEEALDISEALRGAERDNGILHVINALADKRDFDRALGLFNRMRDPSDRASALIRIAIAYQKIGDPQRAATLGRLAFEEASKVTDPVPRLLESKPGDARRLTMARAARLLAEAGITASTFDNAALQKDPAEHEQLKLIAADALRTDGDPKRLTFVIEAMKHSDAPGLSIYLRQLAKAGQVTEALEVAKARKSESLRDLATGGVAEGLAEAGRTKEALALAEGIQSAFGRAQALHSVARAAASLGMSDAIVIAERIPAGERNRSLAFQQIAERMAEHGRVQEALKAVHQVEVDERASTLYSIVLNLIEAAKASEAGTVAKTIQEPYYRVQALAAAAAGIGRQNEDSEVALSMAREAGALAPTVGDDAKRSSGYVSVGRAWASLGKLRLARLAAERCTNSSDRLFVYSLIQRRYAGIKDR